MHFDHIGNFEAFPNAKLYVQLDEYIGWLQAVSFAKNRGEREDQSWVFSSFDPEDLVKASRGVADGRIVFLRGDVKNDTRRIVPGHAPVIWERHPSWLSGGSENQVAELHLAGNEKSRRIK